MTFKDLLALKGTTIYKISRECDLPKTTLNDIASGKRDIVDCTGRTLLAISFALGVDIHELLELEPEDSPSSFPSFLNDSIAWYRKELRKNGSLFDCASCELNSSINAAEVEGMITKEKADSLRKRYF